MKPRVEKGSLTIERGLWLISLRFLLLLIYQTELHLPHENLCNPLRAPKRVLHGAQNLSKIIQVRDSPRLLPMGKVWIKVWLKNTYKVQHDFFLYSELLSLYFCPNPVLFHPVSFHIWIQTAGGLFSPQTNPKITLLLITK